METSAKHPSEYVRLHTSICVVVIAGLALLATLVVFVFGYVNTLTLSGSAFILIVTSIWLALEAHKMVNQHRSLKQKDNKLEEAIDIRTEFLQIASHQLRTPLTSLYGLVELDAAGYPHELPPEKHKEFHERMLESASRLTNLVNGLLSTLRLEGDDLPLIFKSVDPQKIVGEAIGVVRSKFEDKNITLTVEPPAKKIPAIDGDREYLRQVFINLLDNAQRYTPKGGSATVKIHIAGSAVVVNIIDTGIGITAEEHTQIFQKFARSERAREFQPEGTGLGLYIASKIAAGHHGNLEMISEGENKGTTARVTIPVKHKNIHYHLEEEGKDPQ